MDYWRVAHAQAIDNLDWYAENQPYNLGAYVHDIFKKSPPFTSQEDAMKYAVELSQNYNILEYGIVVIDMSELTGREFIFYGD